MHYITITYNSEDVKMMYVYMPIYLKLYCKLLLVYKKNILYSQLINSKS